MIAHLSHPLVQCHSLCRKQEREGRDAKALSAYHVGLAVKGGAASFRGINGASPRRRGSLPFIPRSPRASLDCCARRDAANAGNPAHRRSTMATLTPRFPDVHVQLNGMDGNVFLIIGRIRQALRNGGASQDQIDDFTKEVTSASSYD